MFAMDDNEFSLPDSPAPELNDISPDDDENVAFEKQRATLQVYLESLPYECESTEEMEERLREIVSKIYICVRAGDWQTLTSWDGLLQCWLTMRYPIRKSLRISLVKLYFQLCLMPDVEPRMIRGWAEMFTRLLGENQQSKRKLEAKDLSLPWKTLWRVLRKELQPRKRLLDSSRNLVNILLYLSERSKRYYPADEIPEMLNTFLPLLTQESVLTMIPVLTSFLPPTRPSDYMVIIFKIWEAFNSNVIDERLLEFFGNLAEEHVAGLANPDGGIPWKDVGIWSSEQWDILIAKCNPSMNVPLGIERPGVSSSTASQADMIQDKEQRRIKKVINRYRALAQIFVYSMSTDQLTEETSATGKGGPLSGSKALDSLNKLITSMENFFHPSNIGPWSAPLASFLQNLASEFCKRWKEEEEKSCKTPVMQRLTPAIMHSFVETLRIPTLLAMFGKDPISTGLAQATLRSMALLAPHLIMPDLLNRAYSGLEAVVETHRTTAVLSMLSGVAYPLVSEHRWLPGPKNVVPLLELCIPGIDLNDPGKTVCATMFICAVVQCLKLGELSYSGSGTSAMVFGDDAPMTTDMEVDSEATGLPDGVETGSGSISNLSKAEERALVRDSTVGFADWVISLFRRIFALYENLPEEGGKKNTTGGKQEEAVLRSIKSTLDVVCLHLSEALFDLVLRTVYEYATTNAKSNSVRAFGQLVGCLARARPERTINMFLPFCVDQIKDELRHGASSLRTTSSTEAQPSDTTLHWNLSILRGCLGYGGTALLKYESLILEVLMLLVDKTKNERGYSNSGRLVTRIMQTLSSVYPLNYRFVNTDEWDQPDFDALHNERWGTLYEAKDVKVEWHRPSEAEINFILKIITEIVSPILDKLDRLLDEVSGWDNVSYNDFCRYIQFVTHTWSGLPTLFVENFKEDANLCLSDSDTPEMVVTPLQVNAGFCLTDVNDPRYKLAVECRNKYGQLVHRAAETLRNAASGEDHIDVILAVAKAIDVYLLEYGMTKDDYTSLQKNYAVARDLNRMFPKQKTNSRQVFLKRAQVYHSGRVYMHALYRRRSVLDDKLLDELIEMSLSPYTRVRRYGQAILHNVCLYYVRSHRFLIPKVFEALGKGTDPDRMKGALYILWNKATAAFALSDMEYRSRYLLLLLECQWQEKPSIQKLISSIHHDCLANLVEEMSSADPSVLFDRFPGLFQVLENLEREFKLAIDSSSIISDLLKLYKAAFDRRLVGHQEMIEQIVELAKAPTTHWRYTQMALQFLTHLLKRTIPTSPNVANFLAESTISSHPNIRSFAQKGAIKILCFIKMRSFSSDYLSLWFGEWENPLKRIVSHKEFELSKSLEDLDLQDTVDGSNVDFYVDKLRAGFLVWDDAVEAYSPRTDASLYGRWEEQSQEVLNAIEQVISQPSYFSTLLGLWGQESSSNKITETSDLPLRVENITWLKSIAKMYEDKYLDSMLAAIDPLCNESDRFKQRSAVESLAGLMRGMKHWRSSSNKNLWSWFIKRMPVIFGQIKPDTVTMWGSFFNFQCMRRDPRRILPLLHWLLALPLDFHGDSAFTTNKTLGLLNMSVEALGMRFQALSDRYITVLFDNADTGYAEIRLQMAQTLHELMGTQWQPGYKSVDAFVQACQNERDPLKIRDAKYLPRVVSIVGQLQTLKQQRLPPPRVNQSQYDKIGLTLLLWIVYTVHSSHASTIFPYVVPIIPEILGMLELYDNTDLPVYSSAILYMLSTVTPPRDYVEKVAETFINTIQSSSSWRIKFGLRMLISFYYRNLTSFSDECIDKLINVVLSCLSDENVEVREMAAKALSGLLRCSQRHRILPLKDRFVAQVRKIRLPSRQSSGYPESMKQLHGAILGICALIESFPYSVEPWMPPLTDVLSPHSSDPPPISTTIRKCASEFKKTHQDTWHTDQLAFDEEQLQSLSNMLIGTSYYA